MVLFFFVSLSLMVFFLGLVLMARLFPFRSPVLGVGLCWFSPFFYVFVSEVQCFDIVLLILFSDTLSFVSIVSIGSIL